MNNETKRAAKKFLSDSLERVESKSIREWATSAHNYPLWLEIAAKAVANGKTDTSMFAAYIACVAIGA